MSAIILATCYTLYAVGVYRSALRGGWKPGTTFRQRWRCRIRLARTAAIWPYVLGYNLTQPRVLKFF